MNEGPSLPQGATPRDGRPHWLVEPPETGWLALWLLCGPGLITLLSYLVFILVSGRAPALVEPESAWHLLAAMAAVLFAQRVWRRSRQFPLLILLASSVLGIVVARVLSFTLPQWLIDEPGEGVNLLASEWVIIPQTATLLLLTALAWAVSYGVLRGFLRNSHSAET